MFKGVLYPTDLSEVSIHALDNCIPELSHMGHDGPVIYEVPDKNGLVTKIKSIPRSKYEVTGSFEVSIVYEIPEDTNYFAEVKRKAIEDLKAITGGLIERGIRSHYSLLLNKSKILPEGVCPYCDVVQKAHCEMIDLIVLPTKSKTVLRDLIVGPAKNVARKCSIPILLLKYEWDEEMNRPKEEIDYKGMFDRPLIALDFSTCSDRVADTVSKFAERVKEGVLLHVIDYGSQQEVEENVSKAEGELESYSQIFSFPSRNRIAVGNAPENILETAEDIDASMIILGKCDRKTVKEFLMKSRANPVMRKSKKPVLIVPC
ncbi:MAG: universal stress protein [Halobacteriota archaeon]